MAKGSNWSWFIMVDARGYVKRYSKGEAEALFARGHLWPLEEFRGVPKGDPSQERHC